MVAKRVNVTWFVTINPMPEWRSGVAIATGWAIYGHESARFGGEVGFCAECD
jgi:hypothetical protein